MKKLTQAELDRILQQHSLWLQTDGDQGACAQLSHANLTGVDLSCANLHDAWLSGARLVGADLTGANLSGAYLYRADLSQAQIGADTRLHQCLDFRHLTCSPNALPWLILHPGWSDWKSTVVVVEDNPK